MNKKPIALWLCLIMLVLLSACNASKTTGDTSTPAQTIVVESESSKTPYKISFDLPSNWQYSVQQANDESYKLTVSVYPEGKDGKEEAICIQSSKAFGICGTGLEQEDIELNGMKGWRGYYDGSDIWDIIMFDDYEGCAVINNAKSWTKEYEAAIDTILNSLEFISVNE